MPRAKQHIIDVPDIEKVGIYAIYNRKTQKYYVGSSVNIKRRMKEHRDNIEKMIGSNLKINEDLKSESDVKNFSFIVLESFDDYTITERALREKEEYYIEKYDANNGYNNEYRRPNFSGYFGKEELLFCQKYQYHYRKPNKSDIEKMTDKQLLINYKSSILENKDSMRVYLLEGEILNRLRKGN